MEYTASGTVSAGPVTLKYVQVITDGTNDAVVIGYNKPTSSGIAAGNKVFEFTVVGANNYGGGAVGGREGVRCDEGLYVTVSENGASFIPDC